MGSVAKGRGSEAAKRGPSGRHDRRVRNERAALGCSFVTRYLASETGRSDSGLGVCAKSAEHIPTEAPRAALVAQFPLVTLFAPFALLVSLKTC